MFSLKLKYFIARPSSLKNRPYFDRRDVVLVEKQHDHIPVNLRDSDTKKYIDTITYIFNCYSQSGNEYISIIQVLSPRPTLESHVKFYCSCPSFKYEFAEALHKRNTLYGDSIRDVFNGRPLMGLGRYSRYMGTPSRPIRRRRPRPPKLYICKHLEACTSFLL